MNRWKELKGSLQLKSVLPNRFILIGFIIIITSATLFWIITADNDPFQPPIVNYDDKNKPDFSSLSKNNVGKDPKDYYLRGEASLNDTANAEGKQLSVKNERYMCGTPFASSTYYMEEYYIPLTCSQPVGITVDSSNRIWFVATWSGYLVVFDPDTPVR